MRWSGVSVRFAVQSRLGGEQLHFLARDTLLEHLRARRKAHDDDFLVAMLIGGRPLARLPMLQVAGAIEDASSDGALCESFVRAASRVWREQAREYV